MQKKYLPVIDLCIARNTVRYSYSVFSFLIIFLVTNHLPIMITLHLVTLRFNIIIKIFFCKIRF